MKPTFRLIVSIGLGFVVSGLVWIIFLQPSVNTNSLDSHYQQDAFNKLENRLDHLEKSINTDQGRNIDADPWYLKYLLPSILTFLVGIISFYFSQLYMRHLDSKKDKEKYLGHLKIISEEIKRNLDLECQLHAYLYVRILPTFSLSFYISESMFHELSSVCLNYDLLKRIFHRYFEFRHIQNRIDKTIAKAKELEDTLKSYPNDKHKINFASDIYESERLGTILLIQGNIKCTYKLHNDIIREIELNENKSYLSLLADNYLQNKYSEFQKESDVIKMAKHYNIDISKREKFF